MATKAKLETETHATPDNAAAVYTLGQPAKEGAKPQMDLTVKAHDGRVLFTHDELADKKDKAYGNYAGQGVIPLEVLEDLGELRLEVDHAMIANSVNRCRAHNKAIGGATHSFHVWDMPRPGIPGCVAFDISTRGWDDAKVRRFIEIAWRRGWSVGVAGTFIHIDRRHRYGWGQAWGHYKDVNKDLLPFMDTLTKRPGSRW